MHQSVLKVEEDSFEDEIVRCSYFNCRVDSKGTAASVAPASHNPSGDHRRFQHQSNKAAAAAEQLPIGLHRSGQRNRVEPSKANVNSIGHLSASDEAQSALTAANSSYRHDSDVYDIYQFQLTNVSAEINSRSQEDTSEEDVSSSTPDIQAHSARFRSASFCKGVTPANKTNVFSANRSVETRIPSCSILESILLNRNIPKFYSTRLVAHSERDALTSDTYKRPMLHSLPLRTLIPTCAARKAHSNQDPHGLHWMSRRDINSEGPLCLTFKKRKVSLENDPYISENKFASGRESEGNSSDSDQAESSKPVQMSFSAREVPSSGSILHTLLTKTCSGIEEQSNQGLSENSGEFFHNSLTYRERTAGSDTCLMNQKPGSRISHVDWSESLKTLEMLALADKSRHCINWQTSIRQQRVVIAKKMQLVVNRKVTKWLTEIAELAAKYRALTNLPHDDWVILLRNALSRLLLLFMAESNFQFAVAPISAEVLNASEGDATATVVPAEIPTAQSVDDIQRFIVKCQAMKVDSKEYHYMRLITLFHSGCGHGLKRIALVEQISSGACKILHDLVRLSRPDDKLRYGELLLHLHFLASVNSRMVEKLFCLTRDGRGGHHAQVDDTEWLM